MQRYRFNLLENDLNIFDGESQFTITLSIDTLVDWDNEGDMFTCRIDSITLKSTYKTLKKLRQLISPIVLQKGVRCFYTTKQQLGAGTDSNIQLVEDINGEQFACKCIPSQRKDILKEITLWRSIQSPHCAHLREVFYSKSTYYLIMEKFDRVLEPIYDHEENRLILQQILAAARDMHEINIMHRDLKPENVMFDNNNRIKIIDFGFATHLKTKLPELRCGTAGYIAPEVFTDEKYNEKCDIFSIGSIFYELYTRESMITGVDQKDCLRQNRRFLFADIPKIPDLGTELLTKLLCPNPKFRWSAKQALEHPYFSILTPLNLKVMVFDVKTKSEIENQDVKQAKDENYQNRSALIPTQINFL